MSIQGGSKVSFDYTLTVDGEVVDSSEGRGPMEYVHGQGQIIPGLAKQLEGLKVGDEKKVVVSAEEAYGPVNPNAFQEIDKSALPQDQEPKVGMVLQAQTPEGQVFPVRISEVKDNTVMVDFNHPLAGKTLNFDVKIVSIQ
ncbi:MAG: peptidylprolyl isomerase [Candidatus Omnitrophica bacterium]|nr:peptidylprolyl isomerase [Candidatus Omnitrophota bacterium]